MKCLFLIILTFSIVHIATAQAFPGVVRGTVQDSAAASPLADATVSILRSTDSSLLSFTLTGTSGNFEIKNLDAAAYILTVSYQGFQTFQKAFAIEKNASPINFGLLRIDRTYKTLDEVIIKDESPVKVKGDTLAFKASAFKTKPDATAEDLLKKLPGMHVDREGTVKAQGETVQKVYVDGKEFFGNDPLLATKNITADMIEEVELYDDMSEQAKFNKIEDGSRTKAINLKLKKDKKRGTFGQVNAGYGTDSRYSINSRVNFLKGDQRISIFANSNNTNRRQFSSSDLAGLSNIGGSNFGSGAAEGRGGDNNTRSGTGISNFGGGLVTSSSAGINYSDTWGTGIDISGNYNTTKTSTDNAGRSYRQNFFPTGTINDERESLSHAESGVNRAGLRFMYTINKHNSIIFSPTIAIQNSETETIDNATSNAVLKGVQRRINQSSSYIQYMGSGVNWRNNLIWRKSFSKVGRTLSTTFSNTYARNTQDGYNSSRSTDYNRATGAAMRDSLTDQQSNRKNNTDNLSISLSYTEPIGRDKVWEVNYNFTNNQNTSDRRTYDRNALSKNYDVVNETLTNLFENKSSSSRIGTNFRVAKKKYNYQAGIAYANSLLESNNVSERSALRQRFDNVFPTASFNYQFARSKSLRFNYRGATAQPSATQLQPIQDNTNPRYIRQGNPALGQEFRNAFSLTYNLFNAATMRTLFAAVTFNNTSNKIGYGTQVIDSFGKQLIRPVNLDGAYSLTGNFNFGLPIKRMQGGNFNTTTTVSYNRDPNLLNYTKSFSKNLTLGEDLRLNYNYEENLDLGVNVGIQYTLAQYTIQPQQRDDYYLHTYGVDATYTFGNGFLLSNDFDFTGATGRSDGFNQGVAMWNAAFAKRLFKKEQGEVRMAVFDILNKNRSLVRNVGETYIEDVETTVLKRFFMLTFTYKLNRMSSKAK